MHHTTTGGVRSCRKQIQAVSKFRSEQTHSLYSSNILNTLLSIEHSQGRRAVHFQREMVQLRDGGEVSLDSKPPIHWGQDPILVASARLKSVGHMDQEHKVVLV